ncbi:MAG: TIGR04053 family radical SAM/SPASM domain-containing protein [Candidatus Rokubacteria bacterium]|nr:TIGR04053 family radical SAM/SPASM domain-containing protein [Candidatus Rokubacteria bacterium]
MTPFDRSPFIVIWEVTRACALACVHCRAEAIPYRHPDELTAEEGKRLIDDVRAFGDPPPILVLTGGDPLRRPDIVELVAYGTAQGLSVSLTPSGTAAATEERLRALRDAGLARLAVSLDGARPDVHDAFRGVRGSHRHTLRLIERARALGIPLQINTTVCRRTAPDLPALARQMGEFGVVLWALFFLIPIGRAHAGQALPAEEIERVLEWAADLAREAPFGIKTTEAPHYQRVLSQRRRGGGAPAPGCAAGEGARRDLIGRAGRAVTDGNGFVFVDHRGEICPSGFLPMSAGNVRGQDLATVYRESELFRALRDPARLGGRCGRCEFRDRCGGSRARAYALAGDPLAEDPGCAWEPETPGAARAAPVIAGGSGVASQVTTERVTQALRTVFDPELGMSVVELGLVYGVEIEGGRVAVTMTLTAPGCPIHDVMPEWVREAVGKIRGVERVDVTLTFDPPWTPDRIR